MKTKIFVLTFLVLVSVSLTLTPVGSGYAATSDFSESDVLSDLESSVVNGKSFDITDFPYDDTLDALGSVRIINFVEYCYSYKVNLRSNYGLYVYLYNPKALDLRVGNAGRIQLATAWKNGVAVDWEKFGIELCSVSSGDYDKLFYKFRVVDRKSESDGKKIAERVNSNSRRYDISSIELLVGDSDTATDFGTGCSYTFAGYAKGYGSGEESTLRCVDCRSLETLKLDLKSTYYRSDSSSVGVGYKDQLSSVYFSVPGEYFERYDGIQSVKCEWYEYMTSPVFITSKSEVYAGLKDKVGKVTDGYDSTISYSFLESYNGLAGAAGFSYNFGFGKDVVDVIDPLAYCFYTGGTDIKDFTLSGETLRNYIYNTSLNKVNPYYETGTGKVSKYLFESGSDPYYTDGNKAGYGTYEVDVGDKYDLVALDLGKIGNLWHKFVFGSMGSTFSNIPAIEYLTDTHTAMTDSDFAQSLFVNKNDVSDIKSYSKQAFLSGDRVIILRFALRSYLSKNVYVYRSGNINQSLGNVGYVSRQTVFLNFDVIYLKFSRNGEYFVIPTVTNPVDIVGDIDPAPSGIFGTSDNFRLILMLFALLLIVIILAPLLPTVLKLLLFPIKLLIELITGKKE